MRTTRLTFALVVLTLMSLPGCGQKGPARYEVSGNVTYAGKPLPAGSITFEPDGSKGNAGPAESVPIAAGRYETPKGTVGGPHIVRIYPPEMQSGQTITADTITFPPYETKVDLPQEKTTQDFDVPAQKSGGAKPNAAR